MSRITLEVWNEDATSQIATTADLEATFSRQWRHPLNDLGQGEFEIFNDDAALAVIESGYLVRCFIDGTARFQWRIEERVTNVIDPGEESHETTTFRGRGALCILEDAVVVPFATFGTGLIGRKPAGDDRLFGWMTDEFSDAGWAGATEIVDQSVGTAAWKLQDGTTNAPANWPDGGAAWIWDSSASTTDAPEGVIYARAIFGPIAAGRYALFATADDLFTLYLDGVPFVGEDTELNGWQTTKKATVNMTAGYHLLAAVAENLPGTPGSNPAGLLVSLMEQPDYGPLGTVVADSNSGWKVLGYPVTPPGITAGKILDVLLADAQARSSLGGLTWDFTPTLDSDGASWPILPTLSVPMGKSILDVARMMVDAGYIDVEMDSAALTLHAWIGGTRGGSSGVTLAAGTNLSELTITERV